MELFDIIPSHILNYAQSLSLGASPVLPTPKTRAATRPSMVPANPPPSRRSSTAIRACSHSWGASPALVPSSLLFVDISYILPSKLTFTYRAGNASKLVSVTTSRVTSSPTCSSHAAAVLAYSRSSRSRLARRRLLLVAAVRAMPESLRVSPTLYSLSDCDTICAASLFTDQRYPLSPML